MVFSSVTFLFYFLPVVLLLYFASPRILRNLILLAASLIFYAWGEPIYVFLMLFSIVLNYAFGSAIHFGPKSTRNIMLLLAVFSNLAIIGYFKYALFIAENLERVFGLTGLKDSIGALPLPIGISFFTFQALSYVIDVYRGVAPAQRNPFNVALYISLFPQLIAGPIVRYDSITEELTKRHTTLSDAGEGMARFIIGLGKKVLIANTVAVPADRIFALSEGDLSTSTAWLGIVCYSLQIYFDFSGYSDMAIGLGRIFGFHFSENFRHPYVATSVRDFWRRWHISLSTWFRDYLYIPLGGSRNSNVRTMINLVLVFFLCGLWHGASWTFVIWGLFHGLFLALERTRFGSLMSRLPRVVQHAYVILVFGAGWVLFRAETFDHARYYFAALAGAGVEPEVLHTWRYIADLQVRFFLFVGIIGSAPIWAAASNWYSARAGQAAAPSGWMLHTIRTLVTVFLVVILFVSALQLASDTYNPFIYFRF